MRRLYIYFPGTTGITWLGFLFYVVYVKTNHPVKLFQLVLILSTIWWGGGGEGGSTGLSRRYRCLNTNGCHTNAIQNETGDTEQKCVHTCRTLCSKQDIREEHNMLKCCCKIPRFKIISLTGFQDSILWTVPVFAYYFRWRPSLSAADKRNWCVRVQMDS